MRKLVTLRKIKELLPIEGADVIEIAKVDGWQCVVKKGEFEEGDWGIYFEIDSMIPHKDWNNHLFKNQKDIDRGFMRIRSIKLLGQLSQGLMLPLPLLLDTDLTEAIGVYKYEPPQTQNIDAKSSFPSFISKTDEERCLSEESIIITEDGNKTAKEICETKYNGNILSYNILTDEREWKPIISHSIMKNNNDWYEIELEDGSTRKFSGNELIYLPELMAYRRVDDLIGGEEVIFHKKHTNMKIKSIKKIEYKSKRYDIGVADNNNLFADNILVHNCQNLVNKLPDWLTKPIYITEKLEGSSITCYMRKEEVIEGDNPWTYGVCSRNLELKLTTVTDEGVEVPVENKFVSTARKLNIEEKMREWCEKNDKDLVLQGELIGEGIQGNIYKLNGNSIRFFTAQDGAHGRLDIFEVAKELGIETVPLIDKNVIITSEMGDLLDYAEGKSFLNPNQEREGIVIRAMDGSFSFKVISNKFLIKQKN